MRRRKSKLEHAPANRSIGKPFGEGESMGTPFPGGSCVKSIPRGVSLETASGSMLCRWERKLSQPLTPNKEWSLIPNRMSISNRC
jgi:hypothetical protein